MSGPECKGWDDANYPPVQKIGGKYYCTFPRCGAEVRTSTNDVGKRVAGKHPFGAPRQRTGTKAYKQRP